VRKVRNKNFAYYYLIPTLTRANKEKVRKNAKKVRLPLLVYINNKIKKNTYLYKKRSFFIFYFCEKKFFRDFAFLRCGILLALL
jgi:hypothetical protein